MLRSVIFRFPAAVVVSADGPEMLNMALVPGRLLRLTIAEAVKIASSC